MNSPAHYNNGDMECIDAMIGAYGTKEVKIFCKINAFKYLWRLGHKDEEEQAKLDAEYEMCTCEQCGMTYAEFRKGGMLGCANCYKAFKTPLTALLQRVHGNTQHAGRVPGGVHSGTSIRMNIDRLKQKLQKAVADEEYEQAAKLRDTIRALTMQLERKESDIKVKPHERITAEQEGGDV